jgi:prepilin-type N-terminal cleavage/methylation domain-containing protein
MKMRRSHRGFTLVEIMIVVVIIGLLATMAIQAFSVIRQRSRENAVMNNLRQYFGAAQQYMTDKGAASCVYTDVVGTDTDFQLHLITPVAAEDYTTLTVSQTMTQLTISSATFGTVAYPP